ncbi:benzoate/H(+) symporter BenE family transporter [Brucella sp.]|uniref:benzoate/H(+) symporter BenE family transporter n=1 Tax=Brucella sp. TaxID=52132 RepID=UPI0028AB4A32|nr:benzoate/H(+) symporter BenE family transporter [Brucella sp.]
MTARHNISPGLIGCFEEAIRLIPPGITSRLLAGISLQFGIGAFKSMSVDPVLVRTPLASYVVLKRVSALYAVFGVMKIGLFLFLMQGHVDLSNLQLKLAAPVF